MTTCPYDVLGDFDSGFLESPVFGAPDLRDAHMVTFFFRRFRDMCQFFKLVKQISQNPEQIRTPCFSPKVAQDPSWGTSFARCPYGDVFFRRFRAMCQFFKFVRQISQNPGEIRTPCFR